MLASVVFQCLSLMWIIPKVADGTTIQVTQHPQHIAINTGENVTLSCNFPDTKIIKTNWWKQGESEYLKIDHKKQFGYDSAGKASLELLDVRHQDSGIYYCAAVTPGKTTVNRTGSHLTVYVPPMLLNISYKGYQSDQSVIPTLVCETAAFYPKNLTFTWFKNGTEITTAINTTERQNAEGLYEASSSVEETQSVQNGTVYTCRVSHISLQTPGVCNFTVYLSDKDQPLVPTLHPLVDQTRYSPLLQTLCTLLIVGSAVGLAFLVLLVYFRKRSKIKKMKGIQRKQNDSDHRSQQEMQGGDAEKVTYITLDLKGANKLSRPKHQEHKKGYAKTKQGVAGNNQTYATLDFSDSKTTQKMNRSVVNTMYAETQGKQEASANKLTYAALEFSASKKTGKPKYNDKNTEYTKIPVRKQKGAIEAISVEQDAYNITIISSKAE